MGSCPHCKARQFLNCSRTFCCGAGAHVLNSCDVRLPPVLHDLVATHGETLVHYARQVNQLASLTSIGVRSPNRAYGGIYERYEQAVSELHGRMYHFDLLRGGSRGHPLLGCAQSYLFVESDITPTDNFPPRVVAAATDLRKIVREWNPLIRHLRQSINFDELDASYERIFRDAALNIQFERGFENSATARGQLMLLFSVRGSPFEAPNVVARITGCRSLENVSIDHTMRDYESAAYPLIDPIGESGWWQIQARGSSEKVRFSDSNNNPLTLRQYTRYKLCQSQFMQHIPRLQQEWVLDMICRSEFLAQSMHEHFMNQARLASEGQIIRSSSRLNVGRPWSIPSSIRGSFAYRKQKVEMGMAQVHALGCPTLFITFTANPNWPEIVENLLPGQSWYHDMILVNMVFEEKLKCFIRDLQQGTFFNGRKALFVQHTIEFQQRGLPHAHLLVRLEGEQPESPWQADRLTTCSLPDPCDAHCGSCRQCRLERLVKKHMVHKCYKNRCFSNGGTSCKYGFPFPPSDVTSIGDDGFWSFRRDARESLIVPYNPDMLLKYDCHINVLIAAGSRCILYLRKYLSKSPDCVSAKVLQACPTARDALNAFYSSRSLSAAEATWMALGFDFNGFSPSVVPLKLSLPGQRVLLIQPGDVFEDVEQQLAKKTHLELYFNRPVATEDMLFLDYFAQFAVTDNGAKRRRLPVVPYFTNLNFNNREQFALYCLLKVRPARNTDQLRSGFQTFEEAAVAIGVFQGLHSSIHHEILQEFVERALAPESFINYLCTVVVSDTTQFSALFADFWEFAVPHRHVRTPVSALNAIAKVLHRDAVDVKELLSNSSDFIQDLLSSLSEPSVSDFFAGSQVSTANHPSLDTPTTEQQHVIDTVVRRVANGTRLIYINGLAGTGKTFVLGHIVRELTNLGKRTVCSAFTGAAALLLPQGITCHRLFGLPSDDDSDKRISSISDNGLAAKILRALDVVVIDEISMLNNQFIDLIDTTLSRICNSQSFGGKVVIISGDVHQLAPIVRSSRVASAGHTIQASFATSPSFRHFFICSLTTPMRFIDDRWVPYVNDDVATGKGEYIESTVYGSSFTTLPHYVAHDTHCSSRHQEAFPLPTHLQLIAPHHSTVTKWNESQFHRYFGDDPTRTTYESYYTFPPEYRLSVMDPQVFDRGGVAQHRLALAVGCPVFIMRNLLVSQGLANGSQAFVTHLDTNTVTVSVSGKQFVIHRISFKLNVNGSSILRHQFPLAPGFAATISKSQGRSCDQLIVDLSQDVFTHGQLYVALTRCRSPTHLFVVSSSRKVLNIVFPDLIEAVRQATVR